MTDTQNVCDKTACTACPYLPGGAPTTPLRGVIVNIDSETAIWSARAVLLQCGVQPPTMLQPSPIQSARPGSVPAVSQNQSPFWFNQVGNSPMGASP